MGKIKPGAPPQLSARHFALSLCILCIEYRTIIMVHAVYKYWKVIIMSTYINSDTEVEEYTERQTGSHDPVLNQLRVHGTINIYI